MKTTKDLENEINENKKKQKVEKEKKDLKNPYENDAYTDLNPYNLKEANNSIKEEVDSSETKVNTSYDYTSNPYNNKSTYYSPYTANDIEDNDKNISNSQNPENVIENNSQNSENVIENNSQNPEDIVENNSQNIESKLDSNNQSINEDYTAIVDNSKAVNKVSILGLDNDEESSNLDKVSNLESELELNNTKIDINNQKSISNIDNIQQPDGNMDVVYQPDGNMDVVQQPDGNMDAVQQPDSSNVEIQSLNSNDIEDNNINNEKTAVMGNQNNNFTTDHKVNKSHLNDTVVITNPDAKYIMCMQCGTMNDISDINCKNCGASLARNDR